MYPELKDKVVIVTGAAGALGRPVVSYFQQAGAKLVVIDRSEEYCQDQFGDTFQNDWLVVGTNLFEKDQVQAMVAETLDHFGRVDVLINIAGGYHFGKALDTDEDRWDFMMTLNAKTVFMASKAAAQAMINKGNGGRIINVGAKQGRQGAANHAAYGASKSAVLNLTETMALELKPSGINVNAVVPSMIDTQANRDAMPDADFDRWVKPESIAGVMGFLASDAARDVSGAILPVYGQAL